MKLSTLFAAAAGLLMLASASACRNDRRDTDQNMTAEQVDETRRLPSGATADQSGRIGGTDDTREPTVDDPTPSVIPAPNEVGTTGQGTTGQGTTGQGVTGQGTTGQGVTGQGTTGQGTTGSDMERAGGSGATGEPMAARDGGPTDAR